MIGLFILLLIWRPFILEAITVYLANAMMGVLAILVWNHFDKYQRARITSFINPAMDPAHTAYQAIQSKVAIGSGGWFGNGFTLGPLKRTGFIPEWSTDFIFSTVGEELGFIGVLVALGLFLVLLVTLVQDRPALERPVCLDGGVWHCGADVHPHLRKHRDDDLDPADHRNSAAVLLLWRLFSAGDLSGPGAGIPGGFGGTRCWLCVGKTIT